MADSLRVDVRILGLTDVQRAMRGLPGEARKELREGSRRLARALATEVRQAGRTDSRQSARAASTVRALAGSTPQVVAGPHPLLFGSEFGMNRKTGWYGHPRYWSSRAGQFRYHRGSGSYWFFTTISSASARVDAEYRAMADAIVGRWSA